MTDFKKLWTHYQQMPFPMGRMVKNKSHLEGLGFFPGGRGLYRETDENIKDKTIMVLGHDFGTEPYFESLHLGKEKESLPTWRGLLTVLKKEADISLETCFFTNVLMGLRDKESKMTGENADWKNALYIKRCQEIFLQQIKLMQSLQLILVLGKYPAIFLSDLSDDLKEWRSYTTMRKLDADGHSVKKEVRFKNLPDASVNVLLIAHPSYRHLNGLNRKIQFEKQDFTGPTAESELIKHLLA